ncbi:helix-turn-helix transcriptional regulator [Microlunatus flavus]|uniref:Predicted DNA-binding transcriptional regulator YafY, contains an HTH and WYL domains n=1 Tax=Microlunatus flavus TaxID=1036181 RepID=A0A1H9ICJ9_9ACTN|nr:WYL domain-containing protein [Microlunatus flavus]SEQ72242.1 Predicted DNA-binding transcriptional regulator YafY, contains an HTH and WYL domains [Microlunatus flavus]
MSPSARLLRLLGLLQSRPRWSGPELAARLDVGRRTLRYDVAKLRELGYEVEAGPGVAGGYSLGPGGSVPPLQLDDDDAVAIAVGLRLAAATPGLADQASLALAKLERVLPWRLRGRVDALRTFTEAVPDADRATDPDDLVLLTAACRDARTVRFAYTARDGSGSQRQVEPYRLVHLDGRWQLLAFDPARDDWRTFRLDRMRLRPGAGARFARRTPPSAADLVVRSDAFHRRHHAVVLVEAPAEVVARRVPSSVPVEHVDESRCRVRASGESARALALNLLLLDHDFTLEQASPDVLAALADLRRRLDPALSAPPPSAR